MWRSKPPTDRPRLRVGHERVGVGLIAGHTEAERRRLFLDDSKSFDNAIRKAVRKQAAAKGFTFKEKAASADDKQGEKTESGTKESASG